MACVFCLLCFVFCVFGCCVFGGVAFVVVFAFVFVVCVSRLLALRLSNGLCTGPNRPLLWRVFHSLHVNLTIQTPASTNLLNDLAKAMKALDGKKASKK